MTDNTKVPTKVFISYSWDSKNHKERVLAFANTLRDPWGIESYIDEYVRAKPPFVPPQGWDLWMEKKIEWADFVLIVCTETYKRRFRGDEQPGIGRGVTWEGTIIRQDLYNNQLRNTKIIPVVFSAQDLDHIPIILNGYDKYILEDENSFNSLCHRLNKMPTVAMPDVVSARLKEPPEPNFFSPQKPLIPSPIVYLDVPENELSNPTFQEQKTSEKSLNTLKRDGNPLETAPHPSLSVASVQDVFCPMPSATEIEIDSRTLQKNLESLQKQGTVEESENVVTTTSQWLLQNPNESYVRTQLLKLVQAKATVNQQRKIIDQTTLWLSENLKTGNPYTLTEYLKLVISQGTIEQGESAVSLVLEWLEKARHDDSYVRRNCLKLARVKTISETSQNLLNQTYSWLNENLKKCDSYIMTEYLRLAIESGTIEQQRRAKDQASGWLEKEDDSYVRTQYLKLAKNIG